MLSLIFQYEILKAKDSFVEVHKYNDYTLKINSNFLMSSNIQLIFKFLIVSGVFYIKKNQGPNEAQILRFVAIAFPLTPVL